MKRGVDVNARPNLRIIADRNEVTVKEHAPIIDKPVPTNPDVRAVIAHEGGLDLSASADLTEQFPQRSEALIAIFVCNSVQLPQVTLSVGHGALKFMVRGAVKLARQHLFFFASEPWLVVIRLYAGLCGFQHCLCHSGGAAVVGVTAASKNLDREDFGEQNSCQVREFLLILTFLLGASRRESRQRRQRLDIVHALVSTRV